ncbi:STAS/SEC14 domain-containing protein [Arthrobacter sp. YAF34]
MLVPEKDLDSPGGRDISSLDFDSNGILRLQWARGVVIDAPNAQRAMDRVNDMCAGRPTPLLIDMATTESVSRAARAVFAKRCDASAIALLGSSAVDRVLANFFLGVNSAPVPTRFFTNSDEAARWLTSQGHDRA